MEYIGKKHAYVPFLIAGIVLNIVIVKQGGDLGVILEKGLTKTTNKPKQDNC